VIRQKTFNLISLGCPKNRVDSERILGVMFSSGYVYEDNASLATVLIINTCAFIESAVEESINVILDFTAENPNAFTIVAGCLPLRYGKELEQLLPEVNLFIHPKEIGNLNIILESVQKKRPVASITKSHDPATRVLTTPGYAYLRITEGCHRRCRYCTIPGIRGKLVSEDIEDLVNEAVFLVDHGARELILVGQDLTSFGRDKKSPKALLSLLDELEKIDRLRWIRLMYLHPGGIPQDLPNYINSSAKVLKYLDIPFQHVSQKVLKTMGRPHGPNNITKVLDWLRKEIPNLILRTTVMVGFPSETDKDFEELIHFIKNHQIDHLGVFTYSPEEGTPAFKLGNPIPQKVKEDRAEELLLLQTSLMKKYNAARIGSAEECIVESVSDETDLLLQGRLWLQAPEIDGKFYITSGNPQLGEIYLANITANHEIDFFGEIIE
jgi:ribosomal protein S12 methylthiotransferase